MSDFEKFINASDLISRQDVVECVYKALRTPPLKGILTDTMSLAIRMVNELPSAEPERKTGRWIESNPQNSEICRLINCSECGKGYIVGFNVPYEDWIEARKFCVECGAKMIPKGATEC